MASETPKLEEVAAVEGAPAVPGEAKVTQPQEEQQREAQPQQEEQNQEKQPQEEQKPAGEQLGERDVLAPPHGEQEPAADAGAAAEASREPAAAADAPVAADAAASPAADGDAEAGAPPTAGVAQEPPTAAAAAEAGPGAVSPIGTASSDGSDDAADGGADAAGGAPRTPRNVAMLRGQSALDLMTLLPPVVICGPSGVGKGTIIEALMGRNPDKFAFCVSHTTRDPRPGEPDWHAGRRARPLACRPLSPAGSPACLAAQPQHACLSGPASARRAESFIRTMRS
jgi:hypothetical protein